MKHSSPWFNPSCADATAHRNFFYQFHRNKPKENRKLFSTAKNHCKRVLEEIKSNYADARHSIASQRIGSRDFWGISNSILYRYVFNSSPFNGPEVLTSSKDKASIFAGKFSANSTLDETLHSLPDFLLRTEQETFSMRFVVRMVANAICELGVTKAIGPDCIPSIVL